MAKIREFLNKNPRIRIAVVIVLVAVAGYLVARQLIGGRPASAPTLRPGPPPQATPAPRPAAPTPPPSAGSSPAPTTPKPQAVPPGPTGRADPFVPIVTEPVPGAPLPPPPFPSGQLPPPPLPGQFPGPTPEGGIAITGIVGDTRAVAVVNLGGHTEIVMVGDTIGDLRVLRIDSARRLVTFLRAGMRFDVAMGGE